MSSSERRYEEQQRLRTKPEEMSMPMQWLWSELRDKKLGFRFQRQLLLGHILVDFYCAESALVVEVVDAGNERQASRESRRDEYIADQGAAVLRVPGGELEDPETRAKWLKVIQEKCWERSHRS